MIHDRMAKGMTFLLLAAATTFAACSGDEPPTANEKYCNQLCDCNQCTEEERGTCLDDMINLEDEAGDKGCKEEFGTYRTCLTSDAECTDGDYDVSVCYVEETDLNSCLKPAPPCNLTNNGVCDEPEGTGLCAEGSDVMDCSVPPCATAGDGTCDEPEGTGICAEGTDPLDCPAEVCQTCYNYSVNPAGDPLCTASQTAFADFANCACTTCIDFCTTTLCDGFSVDSTCLDCMQTNCSTETNACIAN